MNTKYDIGAPIFLPERPSDLPRLLSRTFQALESDLLRALTGFVENPTPDAHLRFEEELQRLALVFASHVVAGALSYLQTDTFFVENAVAEARQAAPYPMRHRGWRNTPVSFLGGVRLMMWTPYLSEDRTGRPGPTRGVGRRGPAGGGSFPVLEALGIFWQATPALYSEVARQVVRSASCAEAHRALAERGIEIDEKTVRTLALKVGDEALRQRQRRIEAASEGQVFNNEFAGKRIVIGTDGGRVRLREGGDRGRRNKSGYRRFRTPWREPKLIVAYVIDGKGRKVKDSLSVYDGTLGDADATFELLISELLLRGAARAKQVILTADGARWIWNRADALAEALGLRPKQLVKVADYYHAVEHLSAIADLRAGWSDAERQSWVRKMRRRLKKGKVDSVIEAARGFARGRNAAKIRTEIAYFEDRREFMRYGEFRRRRIPRGSGATESAVRRVINLRLKGPSIFWRAENAERMLHMRAYYKAGRWSELMLRVMYRSPGGKTASIPAQATA